MTTDMVGDMDSFTIQADSQILFVDLEQEAGQGLTTGFVDGIFEDPAFPGITDANFLDHINGGDIFFPIDDSQAVLENVKKEPCTFEADGGASSSSNAHKSAGKVSGKVKTGEIQSSLKSTSSRGTSEYRSGSSGTKKQNMRGLTSVKGSLQDSVQDVEVATSVSPLTSPRGSSVESPGDSPEVVKKKSSRKTPKPPHAMGVGQYPVFSGSTVPMMPNFSPAFHMNSDRAVMMPGGNLATPSIYMQNMQNMQNMHGMQTMQSMHGMHNMQNIRTPMSMGTCGGAIPMYPHSHVHANQGVAHQNASRSSGCCNAHLMCQTVGIARPSTGGMSRSCSANHLPHAAPSPALSGGFVMQSDWMAQGPPSLMPSAMAPGVYFPEGAIPMHPDCGFEEDELKPLPVSMPSKRPSLMHRSQSSHALGQLKSSNQISQLPLPDMGMSKTPKLTVVEHQNRAGYAARVPPAGMDASHNPLSLRPLLPAMGSSGMRRVFSTGDLQNGGFHTMSPSPFEEGAFRIGRYTAEERKLRISRYRQKRHERNFSKKIKYACRKTLADSRPRIRGRFARNDEVDESQDQDDIGEEDEDSNDENGGSMDFLLGEDIGSFPEYLDPSLVGPNVFFAGNPPTLEQQVPS